MKAFRKSCVLKLSIDWFLSCVLCVLLAFYLRLEGSVFAYVQLIFPYIFVSTAALFVAEFIWRLPLRSWRSTGIPDLIALLKAMIFFGLSVSGLCFIGGTAFRVPRSIPIIHAFLSMLALGRVFKKFRPQVVFHAAAHKHVPMMEVNVDQAIINNVGGTKNVAELALKWGVEHFVNISTDKAVNPTSVMGASKRIAEMVVRNIASKAKPGQTFVSVRFGNVLGSRGSVIPIFKRQIASGGPVTVTHPEMKRYFMTIPEAAQLVLEAAALPYNGKVYVLDMGEPVMIKNLAEDLIKLSGFMPYEDIDIIYTGLRPGEKLFEELLTAEEGTIPSPHEKIFIANQNCIDESFCEKLNYLLNVAHEGDVEEIIATIKSIVPNFRVDKEKVALADRIIITNI